MSTKTIFWILFLAVAGYGGYYGYCKYKVNEKSHAFNEETHDLQQALYRTEKTVRAEDVRKIVLGYAEKAGVELVSEDIKVIIEPLTPESMKKLSTIVQAGMNMASQIPKHRIAQWLIGFTAHYTVKHGPAKGEFDWERYTWFDDASPE